MYVKVVSSKLTPSSCVGSSGLGMPDSADLMLDPTKSALLNKPMGGPKRGPKAMKKPPNAPKRFKR
jgi:hypothetical protein